MHPDDERLARASRALRRQSGLRQEDVVRPGRTRHFVQVLEAGEAGRLRIQDVRDYVDVFGADEGRSAVFVGEAKSEWGSI